MVGRHFLMFIVKRGETMQNFSFYSPTYFLFGKDEENNTGDLVKRFNGSKVLIHYVGRNDGS